MGENIFVIRGGQLAPLAEATFALEDDIQRLIANHPALLGGSQIDPASPRRFALIARELGIPDREKVMVAGPLTTCSSTRTEFPHW